MKRISGGGSIKRRNPSACRGRSAVFLGLNGECQEAPKHWAVTVNSDWQRVISLVSASPNSGPCSTPYPILYIPNTSLASRALAVRLCKTVVSNSLAQTNIIILSLPSPADGYLSLWPGAHKGMHSHIHLLKRKGKKMPVFTKTCRH